MSATEGTGQGGLSDDVIQDRIRTLQAKVDDLMADYDRDTKSLADRLSAAKDVVGHGDAAGGEVTATVTPYGEVVDLTISDKSVRALGATRLRAALLEALSAARIDAARQTGQVTEVDDAVVADPVGSMLDRMPEITESLPADMVARLREGSAALAAPRLSADKEDPR